MWIRKGMRYVFMAEAGEGETGGAGGGAAAGAGGSAAGAGAAASGQAGAAGAGDNGGTAGAGASPAAGGAAAGAAAGTGAAGTGTALEGGAAAAPQIPEKYQVKKEDGTLDVEASSLKLAEAYGNLEKRLGTGDIPPKSAADYEIAVPEVFKDAIDPKTDPLLQDFLGKAHAAGFTQKQIDLAMGEYFAIVPQLVMGSKQLSAEDCTAQLRTEWKTDEQYKAEVSKAYKGLVGYAGNDAEGIMRDHGNDPRIVRLLARVGAEMSEDTSLNPGHQQSGGDNAIGSLMASEAYTNPKHADHARVSAQVRKHFEAQATAAEKAGTAPIL